MNDIISRFDRPLTLISVFNIVYFTLNILGQTTQEVRSGSGFVVAAAALEETRGGGGERSRVESQEQHDVTIKMDTASELLSSPTWSQAAKPLLTLQAYEEQFLPQMEGWREVQAKNRAMEIGALNRACKSWQTTILYVIFTRWHDALVGAKAAQERFIIFITRLRYIFDFFC